MKTIFISGAKGNWLELCRQSLNEETTSLLLPEKNNRIIETAKFTITYKFYPWCGQWRSVQNCFDQLNQVARKLTKFLTIRYHRLAKYPYGECRCFSQVLQTNLRGAFLFSGIAFLACKIPDPWVYNMSSRLGAPLNSAGSLGLVEQLRISAPRRLNMLTKQASIDLTVRE